MAVAAAMEPAMTRVERCTIERCTIERCTIERCTIERCYPATFERGEHDQNDHNEHDVGHRENERSGVESEFHANASGDSLNGGGAVAG